jgi:hypothetical protein
VIQRLLVLIGSCGLLWLVLACPAYWWLGGDHFLYSAVAAAMCLVPTAATLLWCELAMGKTPEQQLAAVMGGTGIRMFFVIGVGMVIYHTLPQFHSGSFWLWILVFYLVTLTMEIVLITRRQTATDRASLTNTPH